MLTFPRYSILDSDSAQQRRAYEHALFRAFKHRAEDQLLRKLWDWEDAREQVRTRASYDQQIIYFEQDDSGSVDAAIAVNTDLTRFQSLVLGFAPPSIPGGCEFLTFFVLTRHALAARFDFWSYCFRDLRKRGYTWGVSTTASHALRFYRRIGGEIVDVRGEGEPHARYLMRFALARDWIRPRHAEG